jgi:integrase
MPTRLTDRGIAALKHTSKPSSEYHFDTEVSGLALRVYPTGRKSFIFEWREHGRVRRVTLGRPPAWTIGKAREHASRLRLKADIGETVVTPRGALVKDLAKEWLAVVELTRRPSTAKSYARLMKAHMLPRFGSVQPRAITRNDIEEWHGEIATRRPIDSNRALATLSAFLSWVERKRDGEGGRLIEHNCAKGIERRPENHRQIFLNAGEIARALALLDTDRDRRAALALKLALLSGCRIGEAINPGLAAQIDASHARWIKPAASVKDKKQHITPLSTAALAAALELIAMGVPPDYSPCRRAWNRVRELLGRPDVRIHDLRHSRASALVRNGASLPQIGAILGHTTTASTARYAHLLADDLKDLVERTS